MNISIIITFYNNISILKHCINTLNQTINHLHNIQILIVNDNPEINIDYVTEIIDSNFSSSVINMKENGGYSKACNVGVNAAAYEHILLMDCDILVSGQWLEEMIKTYHSINQNGCVSANIIDMSTNTLFGFGFGLLGFDTIHYFQKRPIDSCPVIDMDFPIISSGCMLMPKYLYYELGGQNELYINAFNDFELTYKNYKRGNHNRMSCKAFVYHRGHVSGDVRKNYYADSKLVFFQNNLEELNDITQKTLSQIYSAKINLSKETVIIVNFSNSLQWHKFTDLIINEKELSVDEYINKKNISGGLININDYLSEKLLIKDVPIVYFCNDYTQIKNNYYWFYNRVNKNDIIVDMHANIFDTSVFTF